MADDMSGIYLINRYEPHRTLATMTCDGCGAAQEAAIQVYGVEDYAVICAKCLAEGLTMLREWADERQRGGRG